MTNRIADSLESLLEQQCERVYVSLNIIEVSRIMLRVLVLSRDLRFQGGVEEFVRVLTVRMKEGVRVEPFSLGRRRESGAGIPFVQPFRDAFRLRRAVLRGECDLVHLTPSFGLKSLFRDGLFSFFRRSTNIPILVQFHGLGLKSAKRGLRFGPFRVLLKWGFKKAATIVVPTEAVKGEFVHAGFDEGRVRVLPPMFEGHAYLDDAFRETHLARRTGKTLLFYGPFEKDSGAHEVISAFALMKRGIPDLKLVMAGEGPDRERVMEQAEELGVARDVGFPGELSGRDRTALFLACDIFVLPTSLPGCPSALLEAMAAGCGVVSTPVEGIEEVVEPGINGIVLHEVSGESAAKGATRLVRDKDALAEMQRANREKAFAHFETNVVLDAVKDMYTRAVES